MATETKQWTLGELAPLLGCTVHGDPNFVITAPATSKSSNPTGLTFAESETYLEEARTSGVGAVIVDSVQPDFPKPILVSESPRLSFFKLLTMFQPRFAGEAGIHETAIVHPSARTEGSAIGAYAVIERDSVIEPGATIMAHAYVGPECVVRKGAVVMPQAVLLRNVEVGEDSEVGPGAVLGHSGFGYVWDGKQQLRVPQVGGVILGKDVHIGALSAVDCATADNTTIDDDTKLDNLVQVGHNVQIGKHGVFASQTGIGGSTVIGNNHTAGGQAGYHDHIVVADNVSISGRGGVLADLPEPGIYGGIPVVPINRFYRIVAIEQSLPEVLARVRKLEKRIKELEEGS
ncbi:MAG TPA: UDP-3-O-(3-hydroxymyristoyl)glucosamine N-acyltransferase [Fimbriimonas sp.]|nr:UDP-3-O-(3-hydroxymyristoyl)glucosamine N-acyltransferase [Fimbriimonas sp.]